MEIDPGSSSITNKYYYANAQILKQIAGGSSFFYIHDRLGSVRLVIDSAGTVQNSYTYSPFGEDFATETVETVYNPFKFTGQWFDSEIGQYYLRARMYDPALMRFTGRDPHDPKYEVPLTLHRYLYCINAPTQFVDPTGEFSLPEINVSIAVDAMAQRALLGGIGGFSEGLIAQTANWFKTGGKDFNYAVAVGQILFSTGIGMTTGAVNGFSRGILFGDEAMIRTFKGACFEVTIGLVNGGIKDFMTSQTGMGKLGAGFAGKNMALDAMVASMW